MQEGKKGGVAALMNEARGSALRLAQHKHDVAPASRLEKLGKTSNGLSPARPAMAELHAPLPLLSLQAALVSTACWARRWGSSFSQGWRFAVYTQLCPWRPRESLYLCRTPGAKVATIYPCYLRHSALRTFSLKHDHNDCIGDLYA
jgi:hypothetical protein